MTFGLHNCEQSAKAVRESALFTYSAALPQDVFDNSESFFSIHSKYFFLLFSLSPSGFEPSNSRLPHCVVNNPYLIKPDESLSFRPVNNNVLDLSITAKFCNDVFLLNSVTEAFTPNTLCRAGLGEGQLESCRVAHTSAVASLNGLAHTDNVDELYGGEPQLLQFNVLKLLSLFVNAPAKVS
jgi:hypothetical protein